MKTKQKTQANKQKETNKKKPQNKTNKPALRWKFPCEAFHFVI